MMKQLNQLKIIKRELTNNLALTKSLNLWHVERKGIVT